MSLVPLSGYVRAMAAVTVVNENGIAIQGARVYGAWSGATTDTDNGLTSSTGRVSLSSNTIKRVAGQRFIFTVTNIVLSGCTYDAGANAARSASITG